MLPAKKLPRYGFLERMEHEAAEFGMLNPNALVAAFGEGNRAIVESFLRVWREEKRKLLEAIPNTGESGRTFDRQRASTVVRNFFESMRPENRRFMRLTLETYYKQMMLDLKEEEAREDIERLEFAVDS